MRLTEIVRRYEFLVEHLFVEPSVYAPFPLGGEVTLTTYLRRIEADVVRQALLETGGRKGEAAKLLHTSYRRQFNPPRGGRRHAVLEAAGVVRTRGI